MYEHLPPTAGDPIFKIADFCRKDNREPKVDLAVGIYLDERGRIPLLDTVHQAELQLAAQANHRNYLPMEGLDVYNRSVQELFFGTTDNRITTVQTLGGTGAIRLGAELLHRAFPESEAWIGKPGWSNHFALFAGAGVRTHDYTYYDATAGGLQFEQMLHCFQNLPQRSIVLLQPSCHNPTGCDLNELQWIQLIQIIQEKELIPFLDIAYLGFGEDLQQDAQIIRRLMTLNIPFLLASSFSKNFGLYAERVGALSVFTPSAKEAELVQGVLRGIIRASYSTPPLHGMLVVTTVLNSPDLRAKWVQEVNQMRLRIQAMRHLAATQLETKAPEIARCIREQKGMFSYLPLSIEQVIDLREKHAIYLLENGRINVPGLNPSNIDYFIQSLQQVI